MTMRSVYQPLFYFFFFLLSKIFPLVLSSGARPMLSPPKRGVWLVALDLVTVFRLGGAHFQGKLIRSHARLNIRSTLPY